jgi:molecular chaperone GrpE
MTESATTPVSDADAQDPGLVSSPDAAEIERLTRDLEASRKRVDELARAILAGDRDREAYKQRLAREREQMLDVERGNVAQTLLEAIDELDLCLGSADESPLAKGVRLIRDNLLRKAESTGIERVELNGQPYDPNLAEASDMELTPHQAEDGRVVATIRGCYQLRGRVIRPGRVRIARFVQPARA